MNLDQMIELDRSLRMPPKGETRAPAVNARAILLLQREISRAVSWEAEMLANYYVLE